MGHNYCVVNQMLRLLSSSRGLTVAAARRGAPSFRPSMHPSLGHRMMCAAAETKAKEEGDASEEGEAGKVNDSEPTSAADEQIAELEKQLGESNEKVKVLTDKYQRSLAEIENVRRRAKIDVDDTHKYAVKKFATALLEVADNLGRALKHVPT